MDKIQILQDELVILSRSGAPDAQCGSRELLNSPKGIEHPAHPPPERSLGRRQKQARVVSSTLDTSKEVEPVTNIIQRIEEGAHTRVQAKAAGIGVSDPSMRGGLGALQAGPMERLESRHRGAEGADRKPQASTARLTGADPERL
jgi:hypothetical protein